MHFLTKVSPIVRGSIFPLTAKIGENLLFSDDWSSAGYQVKGLKRLGYFAY